MIKKIFSLNNLFVFTVLFFVLSFVNINLAILGLICMVLPLVIYFKTKKKIWCQKICPRAKLFTRILKKISFGLSTPKFLKSSNVKQGFLAYFIVNFSVAVLRSIRVFNGSLIANTTVRFFMFFKMPFKLPQLLSIETNPAVLNFAYSIFSMFFTTTIIGLVLGILFTPRSWCAICPIQTITSYKNNV